jgi:hypothetical protein
LSLKTKSPLAIHFLAVGFFEREFDLAQLPPGQKTIIRVPDITVEFTVKPVLWLMGVMPPYYKHRGRSALLEFPMQRIEN